MQSRSLYMSTVPQVCGRFNSQRKRYMPICRTARQSKMTHGLGNVLYGTAGIRTYTYSTVQNCDFVRAQWLTTFLSQFIVRQSENCKFNFYPIMLFPILSCSYPIMEHWNKPFVILFSILSSLFLSYHGTMKHANRILHFPIIIL